MGVLQDILALNGVARPDERPLYSYRLPESLRARAEAVLQQIGELRFSQSTPGAALFCLYAAHRLRDAHTEGAWRWETTTEALGWAVSAAELRRAVAVGMLYWNRKLFQMSGTRYLATLIIEGGGPIALLRDSAQQNVLREFLRRLLIDRERFGRPAEHFVARYKSALSQQSQQNVVLEMFAALVDEVALLRETLQTQSLAASPDPVAALDRIDSQWRRRLPIDIEDRVACELLRGLLKEPLAGVGARRVPTVETTLEGEGLFRLVREIVLPRHAPARQLLDAFGCALDPPGRFRLLIERDDGVRVHVATATLRQASDPTYSFESAPEARFDDPSQVRRAVLLVAMAGTRELGRFHPPGGEALEDDPWVFTAESPRRLIGTSSVRTRYPSAWVVWNPDGAVAAPTQESLWDPVGSLAPEHGSRSVHRLSGGVSLRRGSLEDLVRTGAEVDDDWFLFEGRTWSGPGTIAGGAFLGLPGVRELNAEGVLRVRKFPELWWRSVGSQGSGARADERSLGRGVLEMRHQGAVALRARITVLPKDFRVELRPSSDVNRGELRVFSADLQGVGIPTTEGLVATRRQDGNCTVLECQRSSPGLRELALDVRFHNGSDVTVTVPFPARWAGIVYGLDQAVDADARCGLERLSAFRAVAISHNPRDRFELHARILPHQGWVSVGTLFGSGARRELPLDTVAGEIASLLSLSDKIDDAVELKVVLLGSVPPQGVFRVGRFDRHFEVHRDAAGVTLELRQPASIRSLSTDEIRLEMRPLLDPQADPEVLPSADGRWRIDFDGRPEEKHILLAWNHGRLAVRPLLVSTTGESPSVVPPAPAPVPAVDDPAPATVEMNLTVLSLREASSLAGSTRRSLELARRLAEMVTAVADPEWVLVDDHIATVGVLPAATFDLVRVLARKPEAVLIAWLRAPSARREVVWRAMETLPFLWELVPTAAWTRVLQRLRDEWAHLTLQDAPPTFDRWFEGLMVFATGHSQLLRAHLELAASQLDFHLPNNTLEQATRSPGICQWLREVLQDEAQKVRERHDPMVEWWPDGDLSSAVSDYVPPTERLTGHADYQDLVIHAPLVAAGISMKSTSVPPDLRLSLRRARSFDPQWFDTAATYAFTRLLICVR